MVGDDGLVSRHPLTVDDLAQLERLAVTCGRAEDGDLSFVGPMAADYTGALPQPLWFDHGRLVGGLVLQGLDHELEGTPLVHPGYRRRGIGRVLLGAVATAGVARGIDRMLLAAVETMASGRAFAAAIGAAYRFSEYRMALVAPPEARPAVADQIEVRPVEAATFPVFARLCAALGSGDEAHQYRRFADELARPDRRLYLAWLGDTPVGTVRAVRVAGEVFITTLGVLPEHRRRGLGRQILTQLIARLTAAAWGTILLEVATDNRQALALYQSCGFREVTAYAYYELRLTSAPRPDIAG